MPTICEMAESGAPVWVSVSTKKIGYGAKSSKLRLTKCLKKVADKHGYRVLNYDQSKRKALVIFREE